MVFSLKWNEKYFKPNSRHPYKVNDDKSLKRNRKLRNQDYVKLFLNRNWPFKLDLESKSKDFII